MTCGLDHTEHVYFAKNIALDYHSSAVQTLNLNSSVSNQIILKLFSISDTD